MDKVHFTSENGNWETPPEMVTDLAPLFPWDLDVCSLWPTIAPKFYTPWDNGLSLPWCGLSFMNPPYGRKRLIDQWMIKARVEGAKPDTTVVCLVPARTSTTWWQDNVPYANMVVFIRGRLKFVLREHFARKENGVFIRVPTKRGPAGFPSAFVVFGHLTLKQISKLDSYGYTDMTIRDVGAMCAWLKAQRGHGG